MIELVRIGVIYLDLNRIIAGLETMTPQKYSLPQASAPSFSQFLIKLVSFLHVLLFVAMVKIFSEAAHSHGLVAYKRSELLQENHAAEKASLH